MSASNGLRLYHAPRCSKSRATLALLRERGLEPEIVEYLKEPPTAGEFLALAAAAGRRPHDLVRSKESAYAEAGLSPESTDGELAAAVAAHPVLLERPILVRGERAAVGRPPEAVLPLLDDAE